MPRLLARPVLSLVFFVGVVAACSDAPSGDEIAQAVAKVSAAPAPEGTHDRVTFPEVDSATRVGDSLAWRVEYCSDGSCPMVQRVFEPLTYPSRDAACTAVVAYVVAVGGTEAGVSCPPAKAYSIDGVSSISDFGVALLPNGRFGNTVMYRLQWTGGSDGEWVPGTEATVDLSLGQLFCGEQTAAPFCSGD